MSGFSLPVVGRQHVRRPQRPKKAGDNSTIRAVGLREACAPVSLLSMSNVGSGVRAAALVILCLSAPLAAAQTVTFELGGFASGAEAPAPSFGVSFDAIKVTGGSVTLELGYAEHARLGVGLSTNWAFGPLGNVIVEGWGALRSDGVGEGRVGARGVLGPVALRLTVVGFGASPAAFRTGALTSTERPLLPGSALGFQVGLTARFNRNLVLEVDPEAYLASGLALRGEARLRLLRSLGENELDFIALAYAPPGLGAANAAIGVGVVLPRGRAPDWSFAALVGVSPGRVAVGGRVAVAEEFGSVRVGLDVAFEPYRLDVPPLRLAATASAPAAASLGGGSWEVSLSGVSDLSSAGGTSYEATLGLVVPFSVPK